MNFNSSSLQSNLRRLFFLFTGNTVISCILQFGWEIDCFDRNLPSDHVHRSYSSVGTHLCSSGISQLSIGGVLYKVSLSPENSDCVRLDTCTRVGSLGTGH